MNRIKKLHYYLNKSVPVRNVRARHYSAHTHMHIRVYECVATTFHTALQNILVPPKEKKQMNEIHTKIHNRKCTKEKT